ncbi:MAG: AEC family transporter [Halofilum sp. (in: g-proteobacteria)]
MWQVLEVTVPVFAVILVGYLYARVRASDMAVANRLNVHLFVPALLFFVLSEKLPEASAILVPALGAAFVVLASGLLAWPVARLAGWSARTVVPPMMFNNAGNLGLPLAALAFGDAGLALAVVLFVVSMTLHFTFGVFMLHGRASLGPLVYNPILLATLAGLWAHFGAWRAPDLLRPGIEMMADVSIPLMLVALGVRLTDVDLSQWRVGVAGALLCPVTGLLAAWAFIAAAGLTGPEAGLLWLFGVLPPAVLNYILAEHYQRGPAQVASIVVMGNAAALVTIPAVLYFILPG